MDNFFGSFYDKGGNSNQPWHFPVCQEVIFEELLIILNVSPQ